MCFTSIVIDRGGDQNLGVCIDGDTRKSRVNMFFFFQAEDGIRDDLVTGVQTCALPIWKLPVQLPLLRTADAVERAPEDGRDPGVGCVAEHPAEPPSFDLPRDLRAELEVDRKSVV